MGGSGLHWRCSITLVGNILKTHGAMGKDQYRESAHYSTGQSDNYFDWRDAQNDTARKPAAKFIERFPDIVKKGQGIDWQYAGW
jgi:hypothetical protein